MSEDTRVLWPWVALAFLQTAMMSAVVWVLLHQASPPVIEACGPQPTARMIAPPFDRNAKKAP